MNWNRIHKIGKIVGGVATAATGLYMIAIPLNAGSFTGLTPDNPRGITELRAAVGGLFTALGVAPIAFNNDDMYRLLGWGYLGIGGVRLVSMFVDGSAGEASNWISLAYEVIFGAILALPQKTAS